MHFSPIKTVQLPTSVSARRATIADRHPPRSRLVTRGCQQQNSLTLPTATPRHHRRQRSEAKFSDAPDRHTPAPSSPTQRTTHGDHRPVKTADTDRNRQTHQRPQQPNGDTPRCRPERVLFSATGAPAAGPDRAARSAGSTRQASDTTRLGNALGDAGWRWQRPRSSAHRPGPTQKLKRKF